MAKVTNYGTLKQAVMDWLARADIAPYVDQLVQFAEVEIYNDPELRLRQMETHFEGFVDCEGRMALPTRYLELKHAYLDRSPRVFLERAEPEFIFETYGTRFAGRIQDESGFAYAEGVPKYIAREGDTFIFGPYPVEPMTVKGIYLQRFREFENETDTNWILTNHPDLFLYGTLRQAEPFIKNDSRLMMWDKMYQQARGRVRGSDRRERFSQPVVRAV